MGGRAGALACQGCPSSTFCRISVRGAVWFLPALFWTLRSHSPSPCLHPPAPLCSYGASLHRCLDLLRGSGGSRWSVVSSQAAPSRGHPALTGRQSPRQRCRCHGAARGHYAAHKSLVCAAGWGGEEFGFSLSLCIPFKRQPSVFTRPAEGSGFRGMRELQFGTKRDFREAALLSRWAELGAELPALRPVPNPPAHPRSFPGTSPGLADGSALW